MQIERRISATFKDLPGGQMLGPDLRLHPPPARFGAGRRGRRCRARAARGRRNERDAARHRSPRPTKGLIEPDGDAAGRHAVGDLTREPLAFPADRDLRLQALARGDEGFLLALGYSTQRGYGRTHPFAGEIRMGEVEVELDVPELGFAVLDRPDHASPSARWSTSSRAAPRRRRSSPAATAWSSAMRERKAMAMALVDRALRARELGEDIDAPAQDEEFVLSHSDNVQATGFVEHLKLPHYVDFQAELELIRRLRAEQSTRTRRERCSRKTREAAE